MRKLGALLLSIFLLGCQTIRMKYESVVEVDGAQSKYTYVNSYPVGGAHSTLCWISAIGFGGSCWFYVAMPTVQQKALITEDANLYLKKKLGDKKFEEDRIKITKVNWQDEDAEISLMPKEATATEETPVKP